MKKISKPLAIALGAAMASGVAISGAQAADNPFSMKTLDSGYELAMSKKPKEGKCGEGKCGADKKKAKEGKCGSKKKEGKCGEGKCGGKK